MLDASLGTTLSSTVVIAEDTSNAGPEILDTNVTVTGSSTDFDGRSLDISTTGGAEDQLTINDEGTAAGQIGFDGTNVTFGGVLIGTVSSNGANGANLTIDLNASADKPALERLIENITYQNTSDDPTQDRTISFAMAGEFASPYNMTVTVVAENDDPVIHTNNTMTTNEAATTVLDNTLLNISDPDDADADITITITSALTNGRLELSSSAGVAISSFTLADLNAGIVRYVHDGSETTTDSFDFQVDDGDTTLATDTFNITVTPVNDPVSITTNAGVDVFEGFSVDIGGKSVPTQFGTEAMPSITGVGQYPSFNGVINNQDTQISLVFTTDSSNAGGVPGEVLFETGGSGRGIALVLNSSNELELYFGPATSSPRMASPIALDISTQYSVVVEFDNTNDEVRLHYQEAGDFTWYEFGRPAETSMTWTDGNLSGGNGTGLGREGNGSIGGYNGARSNTTFQGSIDSSLVLTRPPATTTIIENTNLVASDSDTAPSGITYTITTDVAFGTLFRSGVALGLGDTFTQEDLDNGLIDYTHAGGATGDDSFIFSVTDGDNTVTNQPYVIRVESVNTAPVIDTSALTVAEDAANSSNVGVVNATDAEVVAGQVLTWSIQGGTGVGIFDIDSSTGLVTVLNNATLDFETTTSYTLDIRVTDNAGTPLFDQQTITINVQDVYEGTAPVFTGTGPFNVDENSNNNVVVGTVTTTDADGDGVTYSIIGGNVNNAFKIDNNGIIRVNGNGKLDFEERSTYNLNIRATDDSVDSLFTNQTVTISINDLNEGPTLQIDEVIETINTNVRFNSDNENFYLYVNSARNFTTALSDAASTTLNGANGHLVTITSATENAFVDSIIGARVWIAASDSAVEGEWRWVAGPEAGIQFSQVGTAVGGMYENWNGSEPNNSGGSGEDTATMETNGRWVDRNGNHRYVVEWESMDVINNREYSLNYSAPNGTDIANGTSLGFLLGGDDDGDTLSYSITAGNGDGVFEIDSVTGELRILSNTNINTSVTSDYTLTIRVDDGSGLFDTKDIDVNFNQLFAITNNNALAATESANTTITNADLLITDGDSAPTDIIFTVTSQPTHGQLELTSSPGAAINSFTQDDINNGLVVFASNGDENATDSFVFSVTDGATTVTGQTFDINIAPTNDGALISVNTGATVAEGGNVTITNTMLDALDADDTATGLTYTASNLTNGHIEVSGIIQATFTQDDIDNNRVVFVHDGNEGNGSFDISLADGLEDLATPDTGTFTLTKTDVNDAPLITTNTGASVVEGATVTITTAILNVTDPDDSGTGITYTLSNIQNGTVRLTSSPGTPVISFTQDDLDNNRVFFQHDGNEGDAQFDVTVADGGENGAGTDTATVNLTKIGVNDAPTTLTNLGTSVNQNSIVVLKNAVLAAADTDDDPTGIDFTVSNLVGGQIEYLANPGVAITTFTQDDINNSLVVFSHSGPPTPASFDFVISDGGEDGAGTSSGTFNLTVDNTNDAPTISTNVSQTIDEAATLTITTAMLDSFDPDDFGTGLDWTASNLSNGIIQVGGVTQNTFTQSDLDAGIVTFIHDGSETTTAGFDIQVADGGEDSAAPATGTFNITITPVNEGPTLVINDGDPDIIDFNDYTINSYSGSQDTTGTINISPDGTTLDITGDSWKSINISTTLTANTVLSFEVNASDAGELLAIGFDSDNNFSNGRFIYQVGGSDVFSGFNQTFNTYEIGDGWVRFDIPVGNDYTGAVTELALILDDDANASGNASFRNVGFYESNLNLNINEGGTFNITNSHLNSIDVDDLPPGLTFTASNITNGHIEVSGVIQTTFTQADVNAGDVVFVHDGTDTLSAGFDVSLQDGLEDGTTAQTGRFDLIVTPFNDAPLAATNNGMGTATEGGTTALTTAMLNTSDSDTAPRDVIFNVTGAPSNGQLELTSNPGSAITSFSLADIQNGLVQYVHDGSGTVSDSFNFTLTDGNSTLPVDTFNITVLPANDSVVLATNTGTNITESDTVTITNTMLNTTDVDDAPAGITYTVTNLTNGWVELTTNPGYPVDSFTQDDINNNRVIFRHDGSGASTANFDFSVADGLEDGAVASTGTFNLNVNVAVNEAPVLAITDGTPTTVDFGTATISPYDPTGFGDGQGSTDTEFDVSTDGSVLTLYGNAWKKIPMPITLTTDTVLTFDFRSTSEGELHEIGFDTDDNVGTRSAFQLFGSDVGTGSQAYNSYSLGDGWTRFEIPVGATFTGAVNYLFFSADDDADVEGVSQFRNVSIYEANPTLSMNEGASLAITNATLNVFDTDDVPAGLTYTASNYSNGHIEVSGLITSTFTQADVNAGNVIFVHDDSQTLSAGFDISVSDGSLTDTGNISITVNPINDAPIITGDLTMAVNEGNTVTITTADLGFTDVDDVASGVTYTASNISNGHIEVSGVIQTTFTAADVIAGIVDFVHDGSETTTAGFDLSLSDGSLTDTANMSITVTPVNDTPTNILLSNTNIHESEYTGTTIGTLSTIDADLPGDTFSYTITSDPDNKFILVGNELRLNNSVDYEINTQHSVTIQTDDGNGGVISRVFTIDVDDNTAPTAITIDNDTVLENTPSGMMIGNLSATDSDVNEAFTYTLMSNPAGMFSISANQLMVAAPIDFEIFPSADIMVRVSDIEGNIFDQLLTINVTNLQEIAPGSGDLVTFDTNVFDVDNDTSILGDIGFNGFNKREIFRVGDILDPLLMSNRPGVIGATLNGEQFQAFYGDNIQIIRENTTVVVEGLLAAEGSIVVPATLAEQIPTDIPALEGFFGNRLNIPEKGDTEFEQAQDTLRETLLKLQQLAAEKDGETSDHDFASLDKDFDNILRYHEEKQATLREALQKS